MLVIAQAIAQGYINAFVHFSDEVKDKAFSTLLMVENPVKKSFGSAALIDSRTVLTAAHNFQGTPIKKSIIHRPATNEQAGIKEGHISKTLDLAVLKLNRDMQPPFAELDLSSKLDSGAPVLVPRFFNPSCFESWQPGKLSEWFKLQAVKGVLALPEQKKALEGGESRIVSVFLIKSRKGYSGAGIHTKEGKIITLIGGGTEGYIGVGPTIRQFRDFVAENNLTR